MHNETQIRGVPREFVLALLRPYRSQIATFLLVSLAASVFDGVSAGLLVPLFVSLQGSQDYAALPGLLRRLALLFGSYPVREQVLFSLAAVVGAILLKNALLAASTYLAARLSSRITLDLRKRGVDLLMRVGIDFVHTSQPGDLVERLLTHTSRIEFLVVQVADFFVNLTSFVALFVVLLLLSWRLTLLSAVAAGVILLVLTTYVHFLSRAGSRAEERSRKLAASLYESIAGMRVIRAAVQERRRSSLLDEHAKAYAQANQHIIFGNYLAHILTESLGIVALAVVCLAAFRMVRGEQEVFLVQLVPFVYVLTRILPATKELNRARAQIASRWPFARRIYELLNAEDKPFLRSGSRAFAGLTRGIRFENVSFAWEGGGTWALDAASFEIPAGRTTAIIGPSAAGKSTVIDLILRFHDPQRGAILIDDTPLPELDLASFRARIALVSQEEFIFNDTLAANLTFGAEGADAESMAAAARMAGADELIHQLPNGHDTVVGERGVKLSGGQRQRIAIARAILRRPDILILDEATSALDIPAEASIREALDVAFHGCTRIVIAHRESAVAGADHVIVLKSGRVVEAEADARAVPAAE
jgi:ATP-binding cassette, subfamily B, bacterial MsbA